MRIPKIIHFIWAGGTELMPYEGIESVLQWLKQNPDFRVWLWIDHNTWPIHTLGTIESSYCRQFKEYFSPDSAPLFDRIEFKDIETDLLEVAKGKDEDAVLSGVAQKHIRYEIDKLRPNYGASSDLLRYLILYQYGGAYFDSDVIPDKVTLSNSGIFDQDFDEEKHRLFVDINSQNTGYIGNDSLICSTTPHNPHIRLILEFALDNYHSTTALTKICPLTGLTLSSDCYIRNEPIVQAYCGDKVDFIVSVTPSKTGPACVRAVAKPLLGAGSEYIQSLEKIVKPAAGGNRRGWTNVGLSEFPAEQAMTAIMNTIHFEAQHLGIIRLEDHVSNLVLILKQSTEMTTQSLIGKLMKNLIEFKTITACQLTFKYPAITEFILSRPELCNATYLFPDLHYLDRGSANSCHRFAINQVINLDDLQSLLDSNDLEDRDPAKLQQTLRTGLNFIHTAFDRLQNLLSHLDNTRSETNDNHAYLSNYLSELRKQIEVIRQLTQKSWLNEIVLPIDLIENLHRFGETLGTRLATRETIALPHPLPTVHEPIALPHPLPTVHEQTPLLSHQKSDDDQPTGRYSQC